MTLRSLLGGLVLTVSVGCASAFAGNFVLPSGDTLTITLDPADGVVTGHPGDTVGWGFDVVWDSTNGDSLDFLNSHLAPLVPLGSADISAISQAGYYDLIASGPLNGVYFPLAPGSATQSFVDGVSGAGGVALDSTATPGASYSVYLDFAFAVLSSTNQELGTGDYQVPVQISVANDMPVTPGGGDAPEPATLLLVGSGLVGFAYRRFVMSRR